MRVFVTGATGFVGTAVVQELLGAGHEVIGLARSDAGAKKLTAAGAQVHRGELTDLESLRKGAAMSDGVIHTAFIHDFTKYEENAAIDRRAIEAMGAVLEGSSRPFIVTSGTAVLTPGRVGTEDAAGDRSTPAVHRIPSEDVTLGLAEKGVRSSVIRLPPSVHGDGDHGFVPMLIAKAREKGFSTYVGDGQNRWPAVHRLDTARLYRLVLEKGEAGAKYHAVADEGVPVREIAEVIGKRLKVPAVSKSREEAGGLLGLVGYILGLDCPASSAKTRERLGWTPTQAGLIEDVDHARYFGE